MQSFDSNAARAGSIQNLVNHSQLIALMKAAKTATNATKSIYEKDLFADKADNEATLKLINDYCEPIKDQLNTSIKGG